MQNNTLIGRKIFSVLLSALLVIPLGSCVAGIFAIFCFIVFQWHSSNLPSIFGWLFSIGILCALIYWQMKLFEKIANWSNGKAKVVEREDILDD